MTDEPDYVVCQNCDTPCYVFELHRDGKKIETAFCPICGNDNPSEFSALDEEEMDMDPDEVGPARK